MGFRVDVVFENFEFVSKISTLGRRQSLQLLNGIEAEFEHHDLVHVPAFQEVSIVIHSTLNFADFLVNDGLKIHRVPSEHPQHASSDLIRGKFINQPIDAELDATPDVRHEKVNLFSINYEAIVVKQILRLLYQALTEKHHQVEAVGEKIYFGFGEVGLFTLDDFLKLRQAERIFPIDVVSIELR